MVDVGADLQLFNQIARVNIQLLTKKHKMWLHLFVW